ncbi:hypothetical protein SEA_PUPPER_64 [Gordonia phage Pupper]|uniref:Uncharacterized protein n=1 Tax=Gordonia phage Pupper TaxID=2571249 RepID=A0A4Y6EII5_9CAUD|nr:hypothetical protein KHQ83_gp213 [Gordonia phage Pupper]QDF18550.1 hypothetical protein SEA_PUPPER_64 [Gordonia phage Pupper]QDF18782.1 hypothetical protein SEA_SCENTAE_63 [Gordonia phage SCentae]
MSGGDTPTTTQAEVDRVWELLMLDLDHAGVPHAGWHLEKGQWGHHDVESRYWLIVDTHNNGRVIQNLGVSRASAYAALSGIRVGVKLACA